jgi:hypothetical protein
MERGIWRGGALLAALLATVTIATPARATIIEYGFQVTETSGPFDGQTQSGTFGIDAKYKAPDQMDFAGGLLSNLAFTFDGVTYDAATANTGAIAFDSDGNLSLFNFGTGCNERGACGLLTEPDTISWIVSATGEGQGNFYYAVGPTIDDLGDGLLAFAPLQSVPEPSSLALFASACLGLAGLTSRHLSIGRIRR